MEDPFSQIRSHIYGQFLIEIMCITKNSATAYIILSCSTDMHKASVLYTSLSNTALFIRLFSMLFVAIVI